MPTQNTHGRGSTSLSLEPTASRRGRGESRRWLRLGDLFDLDRVARVVGVRDGVVGEAEPVVQLDYQSVGRAPDVEMRISVCHGYVDCPVNTVRRCKLGDDVRFVVHPVDTAVGEVD